MKINSIASLNNTTIYSFVSRRAAGVWTNLPSLTYLMLKMVDSDSSAVWIDFGMRYEMFNHFRINTSRFNNANSICQFIKNKRNNESISFNELLTYNDIINSDDDSDSKLANILGDEKDIGTYKKKIKELDKLGIKIFLLPMYIQQDLSPDIDIDLDLLESVLIDLIAKKRPKYIFLTWEGQPEGEIFRNKIINDNILNWGLRNSHKIISLVRFDSEKRFLDGIQIPNIICENDIFAAKTKIVLTRVSTRPRINSQAYNFVIGELPFASIIGQSVNSGRIPIIDTWCRFDSKNETNLDIEFLKSLEELVQNINNL